MKLTADGIQNERQKFMKALSLVVITASEI